MNLVNPNLQLAFARYSMVLAQGAGDLLQFVELGKQPLYRDWPGMERIFRSAVISGTTLDPTWASPLADYRQMDAAFKESLRSDSLFDAAFPFSVQLPLRTRIAVTTGGLAASGVSEGATKPVRSMSYSTEFFDALRIAVFIVFTDAILRFGHTAGIALLDREQRNCVAEGTNAEFINFLANDSTASPSSGDILEDLRVLLAIISVIGRGRFFAACSPLVATQLATLPGVGGEQRFPGFTPAGGVIAGVTFTPCAVPEDSSGSTLIVFDATHLALGADVLTVAASQQASINPDNEPSAGASNAVSMFQSNSVAWRMERLVGWSKLFATASAVVTSADYAVA